ncbi:hypothetical protein PENANT_c023G10316 [Penicillium antarcticum]|uniref:Major facilitator superfamily (MFS) profile domain-containing protein n=2 Tax=Penicillium antarcticum TaxID=416450 RepID=A0A1V6PYL6_9EURO|nr:hypothetical protein PENANT_c023G10316 [Penicillium antarcticum]
MAIGAVLLVAGLFWLAWTADSPHHWVLPCIASVFVGCGFNIVFLQCVNFLIDVYKIYAASATAATTLLRSLMAAGLPLAAKPMVQGVGIGPGVSMIAVVATAPLPVPFLFIKYGKRIRRLSKLAPDDL